MFDFQHIPLPSLILFMCGLVGAIIFIFLGPFRYLRLIRTIQSQSEIEPQPLTEEPRHLPQISIIATSRGAVEEIASFLESIERQVYPEKEVIIIIDGSARDADSLSEIFCSKYPFASFSFVPAEAKNLSRRKLANTIGIKKATGNIILTTFTNIEISSDKWLSLMAAPFNSPDVEIVLGDAQMDFSMMTGIKRWYRRFDSLLAKAQWMLFAINGKPYRGDGANLAFRRELFFRNSGYGNNYYLHAGDDDIFVSEVANSANSSYMFAPQSTVLVNWGESTNRMWVNQKDRYTFTARYLNPTPRLYPAFLSVCNWLAVAGLIAAICTAIVSDYIIPAVAFIILLAFWGTEIFLYRRLAATLRSIRLWWSVPLFYLLRPVANFLFQIRHFGHRQQNFTWRR